MILTQNCSPVNAHFEIQIKEKFAWLPKLVICTPNGKTSTIWLSKYWCYTAINWDNTKIENNAKKGLYLYNLKNI